MKNGQMLPVASINSVYVDDKKAYDMFRPSLFISSIQEHSNDLGIPLGTNPEGLLEGFDKALHSEIESIKKKAYEIAEMYGDKLASILLTLQKPSELSKKNRGNWTQEHWDFWTTIQRVYLVGGMTSPLLTKIFYKRIKQMFKEAKVDDFFVTFIEDSSNLGTQGLSTITSDGEYLLFDFGQTKIKGRHIIKVDDELVIDTVLDQTSSDFLFYKYKDEKELRQIAKLLHNYIVHVIFKAIKQVDFTGDHIHIAIANYVDLGSIYKARGGYGKLAYLSDNYQEYLSMELTEVMGRKIHVSLHHDTTSMAYNFKGEKNAAVISLGTAFGVAFTEEK